MRTEEIANTALESSGMFPKGYGTRQYDAASCITRRLCDDSLSRALIAVSAALCVVVERIIEKLRSKTSPPSPSLYCTHESDARKVPRRKVNKPGSCDVAQETHREESHAAL